MPQPGEVVPVARIGHLLALKILARDDRRRPQDRVDILSLLTEADPLERARAEDALALVTLRGFIAIGTSCLSGVKSSPNSREPTFGSANN